MKLRGVFCEVMPTTTPPTPVIPDLIGDPQPQCTAQTNGIPEQIGDDMNYILFYVFG